MAREKMPEFKRKGNWKNAPGSQAATKKKAPVGMGAKPKAKPAAAEPKIGAGAKPKPKPAIPASSEQKKKPIRARLTDVNSPSRSTKGKVSAKSGASRSVKAKVDNSVGARLVRGAKRLFGSEYTKKTTGNRNFKANRPR